MPGNGPVFRWLLDVGPLWPHPFDRAERVRTKGPWADVQSTKTALDLLPPDEQAKVLRFHFARDAKLCLGSCLLKRKAISEVCQIPWPDIVIGQDSNGKPCFISTDSTAKPLEFNVSHHGSLVALVGHAGNNLQLGIDIVQMDFEKDYRMVMKEGFPSWARTYEAVFSDREMNDIVQYSPASSPDSSEEEVRARLRNFYTHWSMKEAYTKMSGEALLAPWLKELEFRNLQVPSAEGTGWGQTCRNAEAWLRGKKLAGVCLEVQAYREDYMLATASSNSSNPFSSFEELDFERDILPRVARKSKYCE